MSEPREDDDGQVSEVSAMGEAAQPVDDGQGVAGNPDAPDSEELGEAGPNSNPHAGRSRGDGPR